MCLQSMMLPKPKRKPTGARLFPPIPDERDLRVTKCTGVLQGTGVLITNTEDIAALLQLGCYGKGIFSRSVPSHNKLPQLTELKMQKKKKSLAQSSATMSTQEREGSQELKCTDPAAQEWLEGLSQYEKCQRTRMQLHREWNEEKVAALGKDASVSASDEKVRQLSMDHLPLLVPQDEDHQSSTEVVATDTTTTSPPEEDMTVTVEEHYQCFVDRIEALTSNDPYPMPEPLQLSSVEALYLASELEVLTITQSNGTPLNCTELWIHYTSTNISFIEKYIAYRYYRRKGWVPKSGLKFGVDILLYKEGPSFYHSSYAVVVKLVDQVELVSDSLTKPHNTGLTWKEVIALNRVNESVGKALIICYIVRPQDLLTTEAQPGDLTMKNCVDRHFVREVFVRRWVPDKERNT